MNFIIDCNVTKFRTSSNNIHSALATVLISQQATTHGILLQIAGLQKELESQDGSDEKVRSEISVYKSKISELQSQISKLANQVLI